MPEFHVTFQCSVEYDYVVIDEEDQENALRRAETAFQEDHPKLSYDSATVKQV